ncbi:unnamed protein product [Spirodela intermedia]|uniref:RRM domain-containing protein n=1 Tax=Spirodela intermedia TaxID=51605 RepID=A0A7I8JP55_SPIIN|nr:unnamed protein product [Spirodela intermedia]CAA6671936.1 unnamed protein product [Spirodela intermedia]
MENGCSRVDLQDTSFRVVNDRHQEVLEKEDYIGQSHEPTNPFTSDSPGKTEFHKKQVDNEKNLPGESDVCFPQASPKSSASPARESSFIPERSPQVRPSEEEGRYSDADQNRASPDSTSSPRRVHSPSPRRPGGGHRRSPSYDHISPTRQRKSSSPVRTPLRDSDQRIDSPYKRKRSSSPEIYLRKIPVMRHSPRRRSPSPGYHSRRHSPRRRPWSPPSNRSTGVGRPGKNLFVAGFSFVTTERDLEKKFSRFGRVTDVRIVRDKRSGDSRGFGFLSLEKDEEADAAIRALDQTEWNGRIVLVEKAKTSVR